MNSIDRPALKQILWHSMRKDLIALVPYFHESDLILCPTCFRPLAIEDFSLEHIIPKQVLAADPSAARVITQNDRSGITLLCRKPLIIKGIKVYDNGCNSWKGKFYDNKLNDIFHSPLAKKTITSRHQVAIFSACYLALYREFGYRVALFSSGLMMRNQFFSPDNFRPEIPIISQLALLHSPFVFYNKKTHSYWENPFKFAVENDFVIVGCRNVFMRLPISRDPTLPVSNTLRYMPPKHQFRPDLKSVFD